MSVKQQDNFLFVSELDKKGAEMKEEKKNLPMKPMDQKELENIKHVSKRSGQLQAFAFIGNIAQVQIAHILKEMHDNDYYKQCGYRTWEELCEEYGVKRGQSYRLIGNLEIAGSAMLEFLYKAGFSTYDQYLMLKGAGEIEDAEFEVLSDDEIKINGKKLSIKDNSKEVMERLCELKHKCNVEQRARRDTERELEETKKDLEDKKEKIEIGEKDYARLQKQLDAPPLKETTDLTMALFKLIDYAKQVCAMEITEEDERLIKNGKTMRLIENQISVRLSAKFNPRRADVSAWAEDMEKRNEHEIEEGDS